MASAWSEDALRVLSASATGRKASREALGDGKSDFLLALRCLGEDADRPKGERIVNGDLGDLEALGDLGEELPVAALASECMDASRFFPEPMSELELRCFCTATGSAELTGSAGALIESETGFWSVAGCCSSGDVGGVYRRGDEATPLIRGGI